MIRHCIHGLCLILILLASLAHADLDKYDQQALQQTQSLLKNLNERSKAMASDPAAKDIDTKVEALAGSAKNKEEIYIIAAQVMKKITEESNGDAEKMQKMLLEAQSHPERFFNTLNPSQQAQIRSLANKIESQKVSAPHD